MNASRHLSLFVIVLWSSGCFAAEDAVYRQFLSLVDTNSAEGQGIESPSLVDTNNGAMKAAEILHNLAKLKEQDGIAGVRLGMTMKEVTDSWGKPNWIASRCVDALPTFRYKDAMLGFEGNSLKVIRATTYYLGPLERFDGGLSVSSSIEEWVRVLGAPTLRKGSGNAGSLTYARPGSATTLRFEDGELAEIRVEKPGPQVQPKK